MINSTDIHFLVQKVWSLPFLIFILGVSFFVTILLKFVQIRYFLRSVKLAFAQDSLEKNSDSSGELSAFQAFINTLGANIGNGSLAGIAVAIYSGGPGSIVWLLILATFSASLRYAEVFLGAFVSGKHKVRSAESGPMVYMSLLPGGLIWSYIFTFLALGFMLVAGNLAQCHAIGLAVYKSFGINQFYTSGLIVLFVAYVFLGGSARIICFLDRLVPLKVFLFLCTACVILAYHYQAIPHALYLMFYSALQPKAIFAGSAGFALQHAMTIGFQQSVFASEAGLGTAAVAFGSVEKKDPVKDGILAMLGVFINIHVVCFLVALCIIASGVWNSGETSSALVVAAYETVFGKVGGLLVLTLVVNFAMSVLVASAYNGKKCWDFLFGKNIKNFFPVVFAIISFCGTWMNVQLVWDINSLVNAILLLINICGLLWSLGTIKQELKKYSAKYG